MSVQKYLLLFKKRRKMKRNRQSKSLLVLKAKYVICGGKNIKRIIRGKKAI